jgi:hypothetical protein
MNRHVGSVLKDENQQKHQNDGRDYYTDPNPASPRSLHSSRRNLRCHIATIRRCRLAGSRRDMTVSRVQRRPSGVVIRPLRMCRRGIRCHNPTGTHRWLSSRLSRTVGRGWLMSARPIRALHARAASGRPPAQCPVGAGGRPPSPQIHPTGRWTGRRQAGLAIRRRGPAGIHGAPDKRKAAPPRMPLQHPGRGGRLDPFCGVGTHLTPEGRGGTRRRSRTATERAPALGLPGTPIPADTRAGSGGRRDKRVNRPSRRE